MTNKQINICAIGELLVDFVEINKNEQQYPIFSSYAGGAPCNFLGVFAKYGHSSKMIASVGADEFGDLLCQTLRSMNIKTDLIQRTKDAFTTLAFVRLDETGNRSFSFSRNPGADTCLLCSKDLLDTVLNCQCIHFGSLSLTNEPSASTTKKVINHALKHQVWVNYDPNYRALLWSKEESAKKEMIWGMQHCNSLKISLEELIFLKEDEDQSFDQFLGQFKQLHYAFITNGEHGVYLWKKGELVDVNGYKLNDTIDTTGAGDIFGGLMMYFLLSHHEHLKDLSLKDLQVAARFANVGAALSTTKHGGLTSIPTLEEINLFLKEHEIQNY